MSKTLYVFLSTIQSVNYLFSNGKAASFQFGKYLTDNPDEATQLDTEIANGHPHIYRPANESERTIQSDELDPMAQLRKSLRAEIIEEERLKALAVLDLRNNMGNTTASQIVPAGSDIFGEMTQINKSTSMGGDSLARLVNLPGMVNPAS